jgi:hypothetical protein
MLLTNQKSSTSLGLLWLSQVNCFEL